MRKYFERLFRLRHTNAQNEKCVSCQDKTVYLSTLKRNRKKNMISYQARYMNDKGNGSYQETKEEKKMFVMYFYFDFIARAVGISNYKRIATIIFFY